MYLFFHSSISNTPVKCSLFLRRFLPVHVMVYLVIALFNVIAWDYHVFGHVKFCYPVLEQHTMLLGLGTYITWIGLDMI